MTVAEIKQINILSLAFLGDSVYEIFIRKKLVKEDLKPNKLNSLKVDFVNAGFQSRAVDVIFDDLTEDEKSFYKRARNSGKLQVPKHQTDMDYRRASGLESVMGFLYLSENQERINLLLNKIWEAREDLMR